MKRLRVAWLPDGKKLHLRNGLVNLIIQAFGPPAEVGRAYDAGIERARELVMELGEDLPRLQAGLAAQTQVGQRATAACRDVPGALGALTALTGAVADEVLTAMARGGQLERGFVNNRGAVSFHLAEGQSITPLAMDWPDFGRYEVKVPIPAASRSRGMAAGGWRFDHFALGCVERIFTSAPSAAIAGAALASIASQMRPAGGLGAVLAETLAPGSVFGGLEIYPPRQDLGAAEVAAVLAQGHAAAEALVARGVIVLAVAEVGEAHFLAGPPHISVKSILSLGV